MYLTVKLLRKCEHIEFYVILRFKKVTIRLRYQWKLSQPQYIIFILRTYIWILLNMLPKLKVKYKEWLLFGSAIYKTKIPEEICQLPDMQFYPIEQQFKVELLYSSSSKLLLYKYCRYQFQKEELLLFSKQTLSF